MPTEHDTSTDSTSSVRYIRPDAMTMRIFNPMLGRLAKMGLSVRGSRVLHVRRRTSGTMQTLPVNPLTVDGQQYLVAPRGETQWVRNLRVAGDGDLQLGRRRTPFSAVEITDADVKVVVLRQYLETWKAEVGKFFDGVTPSATDDELRNQSTKHPVFAITDK